MSYPTKRFSSCGQNSPFFLTLFLHCCIVVSLTQASSFILSSHAKNTLFTHTSGCQELLVSRLFSNPRNELNRNPYTQPLNLGLLSNSVSLKLRGGQLDDQSESEVENVEEIETAVEASEIDEEEEIITATLSPVEESYEAVDSASTKNGSKAVVMTSLSNLLASLSTLAQSFGKLYEYHLDHSPILTKSITAGIIFGISDYTAQSLEISKKNSKNKDQDENQPPPPTTKTIIIDKGRILTATLIGLLYFGPAAHAWYSKIFQLFPEKTLVSTLQKAFLGQILFGPTYMCIFFAASLIQSNSFSWKNWVSKIQRDLPGAFKAGASFWPLVDLVSYSMLSPKWIPLFTNLCSFAWTIYLTGVVFRG